MKLRSPAVLFAIGVVVTVVLAIGVVLALLRTGDAKAVSDNAPLIAAVIALGGVGTAQMVSIALDDRRTQEARDLEVQRAGEDALQNYFEQVGTLLIEQRLRRASVGDNLSTVVRAQTLAVLAGLDPERKRILILFLYESGLVIRGRVVVDLTGANLRDADLSEVRLLGADLSGTDLREANLSRTNLRNADLTECDLNGAHLHKADLTEADLRNAYLRGADVREAHLSAAYLSEASLSGADLRGVYLNATELTEIDLSEANLLSADLSASNLHRASLRNANLRTADLSASIFSKADLRQADLRGAIVSGANLTEARMDEANLTDASLSGVVLRYTNLEGGVGITNEELEHQAASLEGATMPNGQKYEDWLKGKEGRAEDGKNGSSS